jgi:hypothetical protein
MIVGIQQTPSLTHPTSDPTAGPAIPTSNSYSKKTQSNNAENKRPEEDREAGRKASSTAKVPASPLPGLERKKTTPTPSTVSMALTQLQTSPFLIQTPALCLPLWLTMESLACSLCPSPHPPGRAESCSKPATVCLRGRGREGCLAPRQNLTGEHEAPYETALALQSPQNSVLSTSTNRSRNSPLLERASLGQATIQNGKDR